MLKIRIISVGRKNNIEFEVKINSYVKRLSGFAKVEWVFIDPIKGRMSTDTQRTMESAVIIERLKQYKGSVVLLDEKGQSLDNLELANTMQKLNELNNEINFIIGGAFGVSEKLVNLCDEVISLSNLVFPHELVRLILIEQIYRSYSIIKHLPYHHK